MTTVFISHDHDDVDFANTVIREIERRGFEHWIDSEQIGLGEDWRQKIDDAIRNSFALVVIVTPAAVASEYVTYEWIFALGAGIKVIPLLFQSISNFHPKMQVMNWADFINPKSRRWDILLDELIKANDKHSVSPSNPPNKAPQFVESAFAELENTDERVRRKAIENLTKSNHPAALEAIAVAIQHHIQDVRINAAFTLAAKTKHQDQRAIPGLLEALRSHNDDERKKAARELKQYGEAAVPGILEALKDTFSETRYIAAVTLGELKEGSAVPTLITLLDDDHTKVAHAALAAIDAIGDTSVIPALKDKLARSDEHMQLRISGVLIKYGDYSCKTTLLKLLKHGDVNNTGSPAAELLLAIREDIIPGVIEVLEDENCPYGHALAAEILGIIGDSRSIPYLINALNHKDSHVRSRAAAALGRMRATEAVDKLIESLADELVRYTAIWALEMIGNQKANDGLQQWREENAKRDSSLKHGPIM